MVRPKNNFTLAYVGQIRIYMLTIMDEKREKSCVLVVVNKTGNHRPILLIFNTKHGVKVGLFCIVFKNRTKITAVIVPHTKTAKRPS